MAALLFNHALIKLQELKDYLGAQGDNSNTAMENAINAATVLIEGRLERELVSRGDFTEYHSLDYTGWSTSDRFYDLYTSEWPIIHVTSLYEDTAWPRTYPAGTLLVPDVDYQISKREGFIRRLATGWQTYWKAGPRVIKNVLAAGYRGQDGLPAAALVVPEDLKQASKFVAASIFKESDRQRWGVSAVTDAVGSVTRYLGYFTPEIEATISRYRRMEHHRTWEKAS